MNPQMRQILHSIRLHKVHIYLTTDTGASKPTLRLLEMKAGWSSLNVALREERPAML